MKKYKEYMKEGITLSKTCLRQNGLFKYYIYSFLSMILTLTIFLAPFSGVAKYEIKNQVRKNKGIVLTTMFRGCDNKGYSKLLAANLLKGFMYAAAFLAIAFAGFAVYMLGVGVVYLANFKFFVSNFFFIPAIVVAVIFIIAIPYIQGPNAYFINRFGHLSSTGILYNSFRTYQDGGRGVSFLINLTCYLPKILILGLGALISYGIASAFGFSSRYGQGAFYISLAIFLLIYIVVAPLFTLVHTIAKTELFDDIVSDRYFSDTHTENPNEDYRRIKILKHSKQKSYKLLFDDADKYMDSESYINSLNEIKASEAKEKEKAKEEAKKASEAEDNPEDTIADVLEEMETEASNEALIEEAIDPNGENSSDDFGKINLDSHERNVRTEEDIKKHQVNNPKKPEDDEVQEAQAEENIEEVQEAQAEENIEEVLQEEAPTEDSVADEQEEIQEDAQVEEQPEEQVLEQAEETQAEEVTEAPEEYGDDVIVEEVEEEQVIYVDEDGNEIPADQIEFVEEEQEEIVEDETLDVQEEVQAEEPEAEETQSEETEAEETQAEEAPKKTRAKSTTAKKTSTTKKASTEKKPAAKKTTAKSTTAKKTTKKTDK